MKTITTKVRRAHKRARNELGKQIRRPAWSLVDTRVRGEIQIPTLQLVRNLVWIQSWREIK